MFKRAGKPHNPPDPGAEGPGPSLSVSLPVYLSRTEPLSMSYLLLIIEPTGQRQQRGREQGEQAYARMMEFGAELQQRGLLLASNSLASTRQAVRLQVREGRTQMLDGPFAEAKEMVGGFFLLGCEGREEALAIAARCPAAEWATVEVRQVGPCFEDA